MASAVFDYPILIREGHLDTFGHVNNAVYLQIFEEARWDLITKRGYGLDKVRETKQGPTILEIKIKFLKEMKLRTQAVIKTQMISYEKKIGVMKQWIEDSSGANCYEAEFIFGLFDVRERKLVAPTDAWRAAVGLD
jgi:acyl-CoA thioester hydrolase